MPDISFLREACLSISKVVTEHSLIINESTSFIGTLTELIKPIIESNSRLSNLDFAVAPERIDPGNRNWSLEITPRIVAGINERSTQRVFEFYSTFCKNVYKVSKPEVAEAAKLLENTFRQVNIALINEVAEIAGAYNFSVYEAISAAATKPYGFTPFYPGVGVGGHCIPVDPGYLEYSADKVKVDTKLIPTANRINKLVPKKLSERIRIYMNGSLKSLKIQIVGISYKPNVADIRESPALELLSELQALEATVFWHDPLVKEWNGSHSSSLEPDVDLGVIISPHDEIDFSTWVKSGTNVIDISTSNKSYGWPKFL
jgi:UDP-N-acetyl-D-glucosamine dehydrogenase